MTDHELEQALDRLPREREPGRMLEQRTVRALREEGLLGGARPAARIDLRDRPWWRSAAAIAAGIALFAGGLSVGQMLGARQTADAFQTVFEDGDVLLSVDGVAAACQRGRHIKHPQPQAVEHLAPHLSGFGDSPPQFVVERLVPVLDIGE